MEAIYLSINEPDQVLILPTTLNLEEYGCALVEAGGTFEPYSGRPLFLCCDFVRPSVVGSRLLPVLRRLPVARLKKNDGKTVGKFDGSFEKMLWFPLTRSELGEVRLYITDKRGERVSFDRINLNCTLVCIPKQDCKP